MAKRKRGAPRGKQDEKPSEFEDRSASKLRINTHEHVADSEDEFMFNRDKILLADEPASKRSKRQEEDDFLQHSDEEVLGASFSEDDDDAVADADEAQHDDLSGDEAKGDGESEDEMAAWGGSKAAYYNTDKITNEEEALAEEQEARRLQKKRLKSLREADFGFDEAEWAIGEKEPDDEDAVQDGDQADGVVREKLPQVHITPNMSDAEKLKLLRRRYPDFEGFAKIMVELQPVWDDLKRDFDAYQKQSKPGRQQLPVSVTQFRALSAYLGALTMYFAILTSPARQVADGSSALPMQPQELREHEVIEYVHRCRDVWEDVKQFDDSMLAANATDDDESIDEFYGIGDTTLLENTSSQKIKGAASPAEIVASKQQAAEDAVAKRAAASEARRAARRAKITASLDQTSAQLAKPVKAVHKPSATTNGDHDLADEAPLDEREAAEKARRKKSLRFYTSRIAQKANKDTRMAGGAGGDEDLPYKERFRDKVERLNREAEARGRKGGGDDLNEDEGDGRDDGHELTNADREAMVEDDDYKELIGRAQGKKEKKRQREAAFQQAKEQGGRVERVAQEKTGPDGRREISFAIKANKGLTPNRRKEVRNPRVKKRKRFESSQKKLKTMKPTYKGGEGRGGYGGELTGIKTGLVKSVKL